MITGVDPDNIVYLNGDYVRMADAKISVLDRGFIYGDGIYDVVPAYQGKAFQMDAHLARLERNLAAVQLEVGWTRQQWEGLVLDMLARSSHGRDSMVYIQVTRGVAKRDHAFPANTKPTVFCMVNPFERPTLARTEGLSAVRFEDVRWLKCDIKSISLLGNVLARQAAVEQGVDEVIQFRNGYLTEGASCNVWVVRQGVLLAPPRNSLILEGVRYRLLEELAAKAGVDFESRPITEDEVNSADELLVSSATKEVLPVVQFNGHAVGTGKPGPVYEKLSRGYDALIAALGEAK